MSGWRVGLVLPDDVTPSSCSTCIAGLAAKNRLPEVTMKYTKPQIKKHDELKQVTFSSH